MKPIHSRTELAGREAVESPPPGVGIGTRGNEVSKKIDFDPNGKYGRYWCNLDKRFPSTKFQLSDTLAKVTCHRCLTQMDRHHDRST